MGGFASPDLESYLEIEATTITEELAGACARTLESLKVLGGVLNTFQSAVVFVIMTLSMLTVFMTNPNIVYYAYAIAVAAVLIVFLGLRMVSAREPIAHIDQDAPKLYRLMKITIPILAPVSILSILLYGRIGEPASLIALGAGCLVPGLFAHSLERRINQIDEQYPTFLKSLGESMASTGSMKSSLSHLLSLELGPLKELIRRALNRVRLGISDREALMMMASETASHRVYVANKILIDALSYGGDPLEVSKILGNHVIRFLEFRKRRLAVARSFEGIIFVMQPATVALLDILLFLCGYFSGTMTALPFFSFGEIPMSFIRLANLVIVIYLSVLNALAIQEISSGFWGAFLWKLGLLLIVSGVIWLGVDLLIGGVFSKMMPGLETLIPG